MKNKKKEVQIAQLASKVSKIMLMGKIEGYSHKDYHRILQYNLSKKELAVLAAMHLLSKKSEVKIGAGRIPKEVVEAFISKIFSKDKAKEEPKPTEEAPEVVDDAPLAEKEAPEEIVVGAESAENAIEEKPEETV